MKPIQRHFLRNEHARALHTRAANASVPIRVDARPKIQRPKKGKGAYRRLRKPECRETGSTGSTEF
jgi:hypothetical protein